MDGDAAVIYGLEQKARALCSVRANADQTEFLVGTLSPRCDTSPACLHRVLFNEEDNCIEKSVVYSHGLGEVWHVASSPSRDDIAATVHLKVSVLVPSVFLFLCDECVPVRGVSEVGGCCRCVGMCVWVSE